MKKVLLFSLLFLIASASTVFAQEAVKIDAAIEAAVSSLGSLLPANSKLGISEFNTPDKELSDYLKEQFSAVFAKHGFTVVSVDQAEQERIMDEIVRQMESELFNEDNTLDILSKQYVVDTLVSGDFVLQDNELYRLGTTAIQLETSARFTAEPQFVVFDVKLAGLLNVKYNALKNKLAIGLRGGAALGLHTIGDSSKQYFINDEKSPNDISNVTVAAALYGAYNISPNIGIQVEIDLMLNNGLSSKHNEGGKTTSIETNYNSIDVPILGRYNFNIGSLKLGIFAGPYLSLPIGDIEINIENAEQEQVYSVTGTGKLTFGALAGANAGIKLGPGHIILDLRFINDFNPLAATNDSGSANLLTRRFLGASVGYELSF